MGSNSEQQQQQFVDVISGKIEELEKSMATASGQAERDQLRSRKKQLREVTKYVSDRSHTPEDRINFIQAKYSAMAQELLRMEKQQLDMGTQLEAAQKERERAQDALRRSSLLQVKLEDLCRQLQKENKEVREEAEAARKSIEERFQAAIQNVTATLDSQAAERASQLADNNALRLKLEDLMKQFDTFNELLAHKDKEVAHQAALCDNLSQRNTLLEKANASLMEAHQAAHKELETLVETRKANAALVEANAELKSQLEAYFTRFTEFQSTVDRSSKMFDVLKKELDAVGKARRALQQDNDALRKRVVDADTGLLQATADKQALEKQVARQSALLAAVQGMDPEEVKKLRSQKEALEGLCRTLSAQVKAAKAGGAGSAPAGSGSEPASTAAGSPAAHTSPAAQAPAGTGGTAGVEASLECSTGSSSNGTQQQEGAGAPGCASPTAVQLPAAETAQSPTWAPVTSSPASSTGAAGALSSPGAAAAWSAPSPSSMPAAGLPRSPRYQGHGRAVAAPPATSTSPAALPAEAERQEADALCAAAITAGTSAAGEDAAPKLVAYGGVLLPASLDGEAQL